MGDLVKTLDYQNSTAYFRNDFIPFKEANLSVASSPVLYGLSLYTVCNVTWNESERILVAFRLKDHYDRLCNSSKIMGFNDFVLEWPYLKFEEIITGLLKRNNVREDVLVRASVFIDELAAGTRINGLKNGFSAYVYPKGEILNRAGVHLCVSSWMRTPDTAIPSRAKVNGSYVNASLMKNEAILNGYDDAIGLDQYGHVTESTVANIFLVRDGQLITPSQSSDMLEGITRATLFNLASELGVETVERSVDRSELYLADEIFLCGSSADITPVLSVDKRLIGRGQCGIISRDLMKSYDETKHAKNNRYPEWYTKIEVTE